MSDVSEPPPPIDLAREADFRLGPLLVRPSSREVARDGARELLEPRVMQVLVALAQAGGAVVSRDDLIALCWDGRVVGEDAINRAIGRLRRLAEADDGVSFAIETIPRVGYRLVAGATVALPVLATTAAIASSETAPAPAASLLRKHWPRLAVALAVLLAAGGSVAWWLSQPGEWTMDSFRVLVSTPQYESDPALSPNGAMIAYTAGPAPFAGHIFIRSLGDGQPIQLTSDPHDDDLQPAWSPQSDRIAFIRHRDGDPCAILVKPVPGGDERVVGHCREDDFSSLTWAPDGDVLYFSDRPQNHAARRIMRLDLASGAVTAITHPADELTGDRDPRISPDGKLLTFMRTTRGDGAQMLLDLANGKLGRLRALPALGPNKAWIDDRTLLIAGGFPDPTLWSFPIGGPAHRLALNSELLGALSAGADHYFAVETIHLQIVLASPPAKDGDVPTVLQATTGVSGVPDYSASGRLAFVHAPLGGRVEIWMQDPGGQPHQVSSIAANYINGVRWSPDGTRLAFYATTKTDRGIYLMNADGTGLRLIVPRRNVGMPAWTADGASLLLPMKDREGWRLWRIPIDQPKRAAAITEYGWFAVHTSGTAIYAMGTRLKGIWRIDGERRYIATLRKRCTEAFMECQAWVVTGDTLVYADHYERARPRLIFHSLKDGTEHSIVAPGLENSDEIALDPVTGKIVYTYDGLGDSDIALLHLTRK
jgi:Tol biopolymer transport system component/DNA-binding winged helix-turn-helix (wHTH) protein